MGLLRLAQLLEELVAAPDELALQCLFPLLGMLAHASPLPVMPSLMPRVGIGRSMWPLPIGSNPNSHGCEVAVAQLLPA